MIICKSPAEIEKLRRAGLTARQILEEMQQLVRPGITTLEMERFAEERIGQLGGRSAFKGYRGYPCCVCASVNDEVIHGIPSGRRLREGDILSLDIGVIQDGFYGDSALTVPVGHISEPLRKLLRVTEEALELGISKARLGNRLEDISATVQRHVEAEGYSVVREFVGHGI